MSFTTTSGHRLVGILSRPSNDTSVPIVIMCHGFSSHKDKESYVIFENMLLANNFAVFRYDAYGHGDSEGYLGDITIGKAVADCISIVEMLRERGWTEIALMGSSFGGCTVLNAAYALQDSVFAVCAKAPVSNYPSQKLRKLGVSGLQDWKKSGYSIYKDTQGIEFHLAYAFYEDALYYRVHEKAADIFLPVCIVHGDADEDVLVEQSIEIEKLLPYSELHILHGANHSFSGPGEQEKVNRIFVNFLLSKL